MDSNVDSISLLTNKENNAESAQTGTIDTYQIIIIKLL